MEVGRWTQKRCVCWLGARCVPNLDCLNKVEKVLLGVELVRLVERGLRGSGAVDTEALCVLAGGKVCDLMAICVPSC